jgi:hypothetical protein
MLDRPFDGILDQANPRQRSLTECCVACPHPLDLRPGSRPPEAKKLRGVAFRETSPTKVFSRLRASAHWRQISSNDVRAVSRGPWVERPEAHRCTVGLAAPERSLVWAVPPSREGDE